MRTFTITNVAPVVFCELTVEVDVSGRVLGDFICSGTPTSGVSVSFVGTVTRTTAETVNIPASAFTVDRDRNQIANSQLILDASGNGEPSQNFTVTLLSGTGYTASGTISSTVSYTALPRFDIGANFPSSITEGTTGQITFTRTGATAATLQAYFRLYSTSLSARNIGVNFAIGESAKTVDVAIPANTVTLDETATVLLLNPLRPGIHMAFQ